MKDVVQSIVDAKRTLNEFYSIKSSPKPFPPASSEELDALASELEHRGVPLPPSYYAFLCTCNGIGNFDIRLDLLSASAVMRPPDPSLESDFPTLAKFIIGSGNRPAFIAFDPETADASGEMEVVWVSDEGEHDRYPNFNAFLNTYRDLLQGHVERERDDRKRLRR
jgi:hypothetical protein